MAGESFFEILTAAVNDIAETGYDSAERLAYWQQRLKDAIDRTLTPQDVMTRMLRDAMRALYNKLIERGRILEMHPGIGRFTLERVKPQLRAELDRRILASAELIRLNRDAAIRKTLQRFAGWATSIPKGGSDIVKRAETKKDIKKVLASLPFEERRVHIDQGQKFIASLNDILATDGGAIAAIWRHHYVRYPRPAHVARDGKVFLIRNSWAHEKGFVKSGDAGYTDEVEQPAEFVFCRCSWQWIYDLRSLPADMITAKGSTALEIARAEAAA